MRSAEPTACARSVDESTPASAPVTGDSTTRWCTAACAILAAHWRVGSPNITARGTQGQRSPRNQWPTGTEVGTCSTKARSASRGVMRPTRSPGPASSPSATSTQFCRLVHINSRARDNGAELPKTGSLLRGFMSSAAVLQAVRRMTSRSVQLLQSARAKSKAERMPQSAPTSSRTTRCRKLTSALACSRMSLAASDRLAEDLRVTEGRRSPGPSPTCAFSHASMSSFGGVSDAKARRMSFSVSAPSNLPSLSTIAVEVRSCNDIKSAASPKLALLRHTTVPRRPTTSPTVCGVIASRLEVRRRWGDANGNMSSASSSG
mmetsp:Transcript_95012/g.273500  ORF Transcript_95012/g.273500 Transcript_95012/m.273500 type:complete len:319 (-) Transcript_95012:171-1127(-)